jgi:uncharacterized protein (DUF1800 family)
MGNALAQGWQMRISPMTSSPMTSSFTKSSFTKLFPTRFVTRAILTAIAFSSTAHATIHDHLFANSFDIPVDAPPNVNAAARFLTQATFGPTQTDIAHLMAVGYSEWIQEQLAKPATIGEPTVEAVVTARTNDGQLVGQAQRINRWLWQSTYAPDQLRQRMAWALSQIFVISDQAAGFNKFYVEMSDYYDMLARDSFGSYRTLLGDVTYHPMMGQYLNAFHNVKGSATTSPDENYAREVMQLFSIGLIQRNTDFSPILSAGQTIPTYDQDVITQTAKVFTGFTYSDAPVSPPSFFGGGLTYAARYAPMACWGLELFSGSSPYMRHDITSKSVVAFFVGGVSDPNTLPANQTCKQDVSDELDILATHANAAPQIARQLIQHFVTSNPSPAYIARISNVFLANDGDLGDVIMAILKDNEARKPPTLTTGDSYGKLREPLLRLTAMWRAFNATAPAADQYGEITMNGSTSLTNNFAQSPLESPTVFNFYLPDYQEPGTFADNGLYSPEFQITNESTTFSSADSYYNFTAKAAQGPLTDRPLLTFSAFGTAPTAATIVSTINANMLYGSMSSGMQSSLNTMVTGLLASSPPPSVEPEWSAIYVTMLSPEFATQR